MQKILRLALLLPICLISACATNGVLPTPAPAEPAAPVVSGPAYDARAYIVADKTTGKILLGRNIDEHLPIASLTKIITTMIALDWARSSGTNPNTRITVPPEAEGIVGARPLGLKAGDQLTLRDAVFATMLASDNMAAETIAYFVGNDLLRRTGRSGHPVLYFVKQMNILAKSNGARDTNFISPQGLDYSNQPYSSARDLALLSARATSDPQFNLITATQSRTITIWRGGSSFNRTVRNTNELLGSQRIDGIKTGTTPRAGQCFAMTADRPANINRPGYPDRLIIIILGSNNRFGVARTLLSDGWATLDRWAAGGRKVYNPGELLWPKGQAPH